MTDKVVSIDLPTDEHGLLPRQCPHCDWKFAVHSEAFEQEHYLNLRCPYCEWIGEFDEYLTDEQAEYGTAVAENEARHMIEEEFKDAWNDAFSGVSSNDFIEIESNTDEIDFGERNAPTPHLSIDTKEISCLDCGFVFAISEEEDEDDVFCPVCRD